MDRRVYQTSMPLHLDTADYSNTTTTVWVPLTSRDDVNGPDAIWTPEILICLSVVSMLMLLTLLGKLTLLGNVAVIITIVSCAD